MITTGATLDHLDEVLSSDAPFWVSVECVEDPVSGHKVPLFEPSIGYVPLWQKGSFRPFDPAVYDDTFELVQPQRGFPRAEGTIFPWVPGVSTPEGVVLVSSAALILTELNTAGGEALVRVAQATLTLVFGTVVVGIPTASLWISAQLTPTAH